MAKMVGLSRNLKLQWLNERSNPPAMLGRME